MKTSRSANETTPTENHPERENFTKDTILRLKTRAGHACSYVGCHISTAGPSNESPVQTANTGVAAHIRAASKGLGARRRLLDSSADRTALRHYNNGIWMCVLHANLIDTDEVSYTVTMLQRWRELAELRASLQQALKKPVHLQLRDNHRIPLANSNLSVQCYSDFSVKRVGDAILNSCICDVWGDAFGLAVRDFAAEQMINAFKWGGATGFRVVVDANRVMLEDDGRAFSLSELAHAQDGRGGTAAAKALLNIGDFLLVSSLRLDEKNIIEISFVTDASQVLTSSQCAVEYGIFQDTLEWSESIPELYLSCETLYIVVPPDLHFIPSLAFKFVKRLSELETLNKNIVLVGRSISVAVREIFSEFTVNVFQVK